MIIIVNCGPEIIELFFENNEYYTMPTEDKMPLFLAQGVIAFYLWLCVVSLFQHLANRQAANQVTGSHCSICGSMWCHCYSTWPTGRQPIG